MGGIGYTLWEKPVIDWLESWSRSTPMDRVQRTPVYYFRHSLVGRCLLRKISVGGHLRRRKARPPQSNGPALWLSCRNSDMVRQLRPKRRHLLQNGLQVVARSSLNLRQVPNCRSSHIGCLHPCQRPPTDLQRLHHCARTRNCPRRDRMLMLTVQRL